MENYQYFCIIDDTFYDDINNLVDALRLIINDENMPIQEAVNSVEVAPFAPFKKNGHTDYYEWAYANQSADGLHPCHFSGIHEHWDKNFDKYCEENGIGWYYPKNDYLPNRDFCRIVEELKSALDVY